VQTAPLHSTHQCSMVERTIITIILSRDFNVPACDREVHGDIWVFDPRSSLPQRPTTAMLPLAYENFQTPLPAAMAASVHRMTQTRRSSSGTQFARTASMPRTRFTAHSRSAHAHAAHTVTEFAKCRTADRAAAAAIVHRSVCRTSKILHHLSLQ
jgi:hypothetical protein